MTKEERNEAQALKKIILRAKHKSGRWYMAEYTEKGGWSIFMRTAYYTREECEERIKAIAAKNSIIVHDN